MLENKMGESSGYAADGDYDGCTIWCPCDSGNLLNL